APLLVELGVDLLGGVGELARIRDGRPRDLAARAGLGVIAQTANRQRTPVLVALDHSHDDGRRAIALVEPGERGHVADIKLLRRDRVLVELIAAQHRHGYRAAGRVERAPGLAPGILVVERLDPCLALPQWDHQRRTRYGLGDLHAGPAQ